MKKKNLAGIIWMYTSMLLVTISLLVFWIIYVVHSAQTINELAIRMGGGEQEYHWIILVVGCVLFVALIVGLSLQMAQSISNVRYTSKQNEFVSNVTHELKSPLAAIKLHGQTLLQENISETERQRFLKYILQQSERMAVLVDNVLEISRLRSKEAPLSFENIELKEFFSLYFEEVHERIKNIGMEFQGIIRSQSNIRANSLALHRILDNLIDNAIKASHNKGKIGCDVRNHNNHVEIEVWDEGIGIPKREVRKIFKRFYQIGSELRGRRKGTGLGLAIVKGLVKEMNGKIHVVSQEGKKGTRFIVEFPVWRGENHSV